MTIFNTMPSGAGPGLADLNLESLEIFEIFEILNVVKNFENF